MDIAARDRQLLVAELEYLAAAELGDGDVAMVGVGEELLDHQRRAGPRAGDFVAASGQSPAYERIFRDRIGIIDARAEGSGIKFLEPSAERTLVVVEQRHRAADTFDGGERVTMRDGEVTREAA